MTANRSEFQSEMEWQQYLVNQKAMAVARKKWMKIKHEEKRINNSNIKEV